MSYFSKISFAFLLLGPAISIAQAASVKEVFNGDMLGTNQRYFESIAGIARTSDGDTHTFRVQGCDIAVSMIEAKVSSLHMQLSPTCSADLTTFLGNDAPAATPNLTFGTFAQFTHSSLRYQANCLTMCGNAEDPSVYAYWEGPRSLGFIEVILETVLAGDPALDASNVWQEKMVNATNQDYILDTKFNCESRFDNIAAEAFKNVPVTAITIGHGLTKLSC